MCVCVCMCGVPQKKTKKHKKRHNKVQPSTHYTIYSKSYYEVYRFGKIIRYTSTAKLHFCLLSVCVHVMVMTIVLAPPRSSQQYQR